MRHCEKIHGMRHRMPAYLLLLAVIAIPLGACDRDNEVVDTHDAADSLIVLRRGNGGDPQTLDPARAEDTHAFRVLADLYEGLLILDATGNAIPGVAEEWEVSSDGLSYTFHLRANATWSNGKRVTAEHFVASFERALLPATASPYSFHLHPIHNAELVAKGDLPPSALGIAAPDAQTLTIELDVPAPHLLSVLTMPVAFPIWPGALTNSDRFAAPQHFVGNGPFVLEEWQPGYRIRLRKNGLYRETRSVHIDVVEYYAIQDPLSELNMYRAGELDITTTVPGANFKDLRRTRRSELHVAPRLAIYYLAFDLSEAPFDNLPLRHALTMAIDRESLVEIIGRGEQPAYGLVPDGVSGYAPARYGWSALGNAERQAEARRIFAGSGYSPAEPLQLKLTYDADDIHETVALAISSMWRDVLGIDVELDKREWKYFLDTRDRREEWQIMRFAWTGDYDHPGTFTGILHSASPQNLPGYNSSRYDELIDAAVATNDARAQSALFNSAEATMLSDYPIAPLYFYVSKHLVSPSVRGFQSNVLDQHPSRYLRLTKEPPIKSSD